MNAEDVRQLYEYNRWANARTLGSASALGGEQFTRDTASSHPSVRDTLVHMMAAEVIWLARWKGHSPKSLLNPAEFYTLDDLRTRWAEVERELSDFVHGVTDESLGEVIAYTNTRGEEWRYTLGQMMQHVINHSTYHRGQVTTMLRQLGAPAVTTDYLAYFDEASTKRQKVKVRKGRKFPLFTFAFCLLPFAFLSACCRTRALELEFSANKRRSRNPSLF